MGVHIEVAGLPRPRPTKATPGHFAAGSSQRSTVQLATSIYTHTLFLIFPDERVDVIAIMH